MGDSLKVRLCKSEGVSPVIATILMVSITVVLAATVYIMVSGMFAHSERPISGTLTYRADLSNRTSGHVVFELVFSSPAVPTVNDVHVKLLDKNGSVVSSSKYSYSWKHLASDPSHLKGGDLLIVDMPGVDLTYYTVVIWITGYSGTIQGKVPPS